MTARPGGSMRRQLILGGMATVLLAVGGAATGVAIVDAVSTLGTVDRGLEGELRGARMRALATLFFGHRRRERPSGDADEESREGAERLILAWSLGDPERFVHPPDLDAAMAEGIRTTAANAGFHDLLLEDGRRLRLVRRDHDESPFPLRGRRDEEGDGLAALFPIAVVLARDVTAIHVDLQQRRLLLAATALAAALLMGLGGWWLSRRLLRPLEALGRRIATTDPAGAPAPIAIPAAPAELQPIVECLNALLQRAAAALTRERRVNADIAHELRTPLAGLRSQLEFALQGDSDHQELAAASGAALRIAVQLQELIENLLVLIRLDAGPPSTVERETLAPADLLTDCWQVLQHRAAERGITLTSAISPERTVDTDPTRLRLVLANLLGNAVAHAPAGSVVTVALEEDTLVVANPVAAGVDATLVDHACEPFWRGDQARSATGAHCGLGLAIAQRLCTAIGAELRIAVADGVFTARVELGAA